VRILTFIVLAIGALGILISLPLLGLAALGYRGALADVGPAENRNMGIQLLSWGLLPLIGGMVVCVLGVLAFAWNRRRTAAEPGAAPNGSPATQLGHSGASEGPPSVS
jgi:cell division protein FtsX